MILRIAWAHVGASNGRMSDTNFCVKVGGPVSVVLLLGGRVRLAHELWHLCYFENQLGILELAPTFLMFIAQSCQTCVLIWRQRT